MYHLKYHVTKINNKIYMYYIPKVLIQPIYCDTIQSPTMRMFYFEYKSPHSSKLVLVINNNYVMLCCYRW